MKAVGLVLTRTQRAESDFVRTASMHKALLRKFLFRSGLNHGKEFESMWTLLKLSVNNRRHKNVLVL